MTDYRNQIKPIGIWRNPPAVIVDYVELVSKAVQRHHFLSTGAAVKDLRSAGVNTGRNGFRNTGFYFNYDFDPRIFAVVYAAVTGSVGHGGSQTNPKDTILNIQIG